MSGLRLLAEDSEDLKIVSAHLQDAVLRAGDIAYLPKRRRFAVLLSRYCWEDCGDEKIGARVQAGLHFDGVLKVQAQDFRQNDPNAVAVLLAIHFTRADETGGTIDLMLSGGGRIRLYVECIEATLRDIAEPRPAVARPVHDIEAGG